MQLSLFSSDTSGTGDAAGEPSHAAPVDVPTVLFVRHRHARRYILRVLPDGSVRVTLPRWGSKREALAFVESQQEWIRTERARRRSEVRPRDTSGPLRPMIDAWYRRRAERELPSMLLALAQAHDIRVTRVSVRDQHSRWGACSSRGSITLNWRLIRVPDFVREYVLLHELMHRRELNHSRRFWRLVAACCPPAPGGAPLAQNRREVPVARALIVAVALSITCGAATAEAQMEHYVGQLTAHVGAAFGGDVRDTTFTPGASLAVLDANGLGVELDVAHTSDFDSVQFAESRVTAALLNFVAMSPHETFRPYLVLGAGVLRLRTTAADGRSVGRTEGGWNAGGGMLFMVNDLVGVRGDARYLRHFERQPDFGLTGDGMLDFWRTSIGVTLSWTLR